MRLSSPFVTDSSSGMTLSRWKKARLVVAVVFLVRSFNGCRHANVFELVRVVERIPEPVPVLQPTEENATANFVPNHMSSNLNRSDDDEGFLVIVDSCQR